jgi:hypothetical protein
MFLLGPGSDEINWEPIGGTLPDRSAEAAGYVLPAQVQFCISEPNRALAVSHIHAEIGVDSSMKCCPQLICTGGGKGWDMLDAADGAEI